ncbi:MmgE/PrpD family protein [Desulfobacula sp.]
MYKSKEKIIDFLENFELDKIPKSVILEAKRAVLDTTGCMIAGIDTPLGEGLHKLSHRFEDKNGVTVLGRKIPISPFMAAMCNSYMANAHDADDGHRRSRLHAGGIIIPAALAVAEETRSTGKAFLEAVIIGFELGHRAGMVTTTWETYHGSAMGSTFGAAAASGRLLGLSSEQIINAMGIAEMQAPNCMLMGWIEAKKIPMVKEGMGWSAASGIMSAYMAQSGITGTLTIFKSDEKLSEIEKLGENFEISHRYYKPHPGCRWTHVPLQTLQTLMADKAINPEDVEKITIRTLTKAANLDDPSPSTMEDAQYSIPFVIAATLVDGEFGPGQMTFEKLHDPKILAVARKICIEAAPEFDKFFPGLIKNQVRVTTKQGNRFSAQSQKVKGDENFPLSDREIKNKFTWLSRNRLEKGQAQSIIDDIWSLEEQPDINRLIASFQAMTDK